MKVQSGYAKCVEVKASPVRALVALVKAPQLVPLKHPKLLHQKRMLSTTWFLPRYQLVVKGPIKVVSQQVVRSDKEVSDQAAEGGILERFLLHPWHTTSYYCYCHYEVLKV